MIRPGGDFICFTLEDSGQLLDRSLRFGTFGQCAIDLENKARAKNWTIGAALITSPILFPQELSQVLRDALALKLPPAIAKILQAHEAAGWTGGFR